MKGTLSRTSLLTPQKKAVAKVNALKSMLASFKIEGVNFSAKQIRSIRSRIHH